MGEVDDAWTDGQSSAASNVEKSSLLRLPPEVRNLIFSYVLGGKTIHVSSDREKLGWNRVRNSEYRVWLGVCKSHISDGGIAASIRVAPDAEEVDDYVEQHWMCGLTSSYWNEPRLQSPQPVHLNLCVLQTCSQIYREAALVPFVANGFSFLTNQALVGFTQRLVPQQQRTIRQATFHMRWCGYPGSHFRLLTGLRTAAIFLDVYASVVNDFGVTDEGEMSDGNAIWHGARLADGLERLPLHTLEICAYLSGVHEESYLHWQRGADLKPAKAQPEFFEPLLEEIHRRILRPYSRETHPSLDDMRSERNVSL